MIKAERAKFIEAARRLYARDGEIEIDDDSPLLPRSRVSESDEGAYVLAWVWVSNDEAKA